MDSNGMAVSLIQSLYQTFGSGLCDPDTGVIFHNRAARFLAEPGAPNELMPGTRPAHTLAPALIRRNSRTVSAFGYHGGRLNPRSWLRSYRECSISTPRLPMFWEHRAGRGNRDLDFTRPTVAIEANPRGSLDAICMSMTWTSRAFQRAMSA